MFAAVFTEVVQDTIMMSLNKVTRKRSFLKRASKKGKNHAKKKDA